MITAERVRELLHYDPETGLFTWKVDRPNVLAGSATGKLHHEGYIHLSLDNARYNAHRVAWLYVYGQWPKHTIDHINRKKSDNRLENLRDVPIGVNAMNKAPYSNTKYVPGVTFDVSIQKFRAHFASAGRRQHLGTFSNLLDAVAARRSAETRYWSDTSVQVQQ